MNRALAGTLYPDKRNSDVNPSSGESSSPILTMTNNGFQEIYLVGRQRDCSNLFLNNNTVWYETGEGYTNEKRSPSHV